ncbi:unnamed protein product [Urochloa humidicola]
MNRRDITELPASIGNLKLLRYLNVSGTGITMLPSSIGRLFNLQTLKLQNCHALDHIPKSITNLVNRRWLEAGTKLITGIAGIGNLTRSPLPPHPPPPPPPHHHHNFTRPPFHPLLSGGRASSMAPPLSSPSKEQGRASGGGAPRRRGLEVRRFEELHGGEGSMAEEIRRLEVLARGEAGRRRPPRLHGGRRREHGAAAAELLHRLERRPRQLRAAWAPLFPCSARAQRRRPPPAAQGGDGDGRAPVDASEDRLPPAHPLSFGPDLQAASSWGWWTGTSTAGYGAKQQQQGSVAEAASSSSSSPAGHPLPLPARVSGGGPDRASSAPPASSHCWPPPLLRLVLANGAGAQRRGSASSARFSLSLDAAAVGAGAATARGRWGRCRRWRTPFSSASCRGPGGFRFVSGCCCVPRCRGFHAMYHGKCVPLAHTALHGVPSAGSLTLSHLVHRESLGSGGPTVKTFAWREQTHLSPTHATC